MDNVRDLRPKMTCMKCLVEKPETAFHRDAKRASGRRRTCKECRAERREQADAALWARWAALERLAERHETQFAQLLLSEEIRLGIKTQVVKKYGITGFERIVS